MDAARCTSPSDASASSAVVAEAPGLFLLDGGALRGPGAMSGWARPWVPPTHHLDTPERLLACYQLIRARRPEVRTLYFVETGGYSRLCLEWQGGACRELEVAAAQCVPFGCRVGDFLLEFAKRKAAEGSDVVVVSNTADIVMECRNAGPKLSHLGFMFVDSDILLPGLAPGRPVTSPGAGAEEQMLCNFEEGPMATDQSREGATAKHGATAKSLPVRRIISKTGGAAPSAMRRRPLTTGASTGRMIARRQQLSSEALGEEGDETLRDSQLDGVALDDDAPDTIVDEEGDAFAETMVDLPYREMDFVSDEAFAETLADADRRAAASLPATLARSNSLPAQQLSSSQEAITQIDAVTLALQVSSQEDVHMAATVPAVEVDFPQIPPAAASQSQVGTCVLTLDAGLPPVAPTLADSPPDGVVAEALREPEHQSQLPEIESSPDLEMEEVPASPLAEPVAVSASQPQSQAVDCSQAVNLSQAVNASQSSQALNASQGSEKSAKAMNNNSQASQRSAKAVNNSQASQRSAKASQRSARASSGADAGCCPTIVLGEQDELRGAPMVVEEEKPAPSGASHVEAGSQASVARQASQVVLPESVPAALEEPAAVEEASQRPPAASKLQEVASEAATGGAPEKEDAVMTGASAATATATATATAVAVVAPPAEARSKSVEMDVEAGGSVEATVVLASWAATLPVPASRLPSTAQSAQDPCSPPAPSSPEPEIYKVAAEALLGRWARDGGREHNVAWAQSSAGAYLEFQPMDKNKRALPIVAEGNTWVLNGFHLDAARSSQGRLHWANAATGAERTWRRADAEPEMKDGAAEAVAAMAGSFSGEFGQ